MKDERENLAKILHQIRQNSQTTLGTRPPYGRQDKFWVAKNAGLFRHQNGGTYLLVFRTRGKLVAFHREDPDLKTISRSDIQQIRYNQLRNLCIEMHWAGAILDPPLPSEDHPDAPVEILSLASI